MVIAAIIMAVSLPSFISVGRGAGMRTAVNNIRSTVALSRQWAITHREQITFVASTTGLVYTTNSLNPIVLATNDHACYYAYVINSDTSTSLVQSITDLPLDITFVGDSTSATNLTFKTDGGLTIGAVTVDVVLVDKKSLIPPNKPITNTISINGLTGGIRVQ
jgi:Tfp pilus assembly protein FimT